MTRIIAIASGKGGVGKTTLVSNLSHALTELGKDVTAVDANLTTPHLGLHLGFHLINKSLHHYLRGDAKINDVIYYHPYGFKVIPASLSVNEVVGVNPEKLQNLTLRLIGKTDFVLLDSAPSLGKEALTSLQVSDEVLLLTNPDIPAVLDALKVAKVAESLDKIILGVVVNRVQRKPNELTVSEVEEMVNYPVLSVIPEDVNVQKSLAARIPVVDYYPESPAAVAMRKLAHQIVGKEFSYKRGFLGKILSWFR